MYLRINSVHLLYLTKYRRRVGQSYLTVRSIESRILHRIVTYMFLQF